jgi:hypothetical protein
MLSNNILYVLVVLERITIRMNHNIILMVRIRPHIGRPRIGRPQMVMISLLKKAS